MRVALSIAALTMLAAPAIAAPTPSRVAPVSPVGVSPPDRELEQQFVLPVEGPYKLSLSNVRGRIVVKRWNKNVAFIRATVRADRPLSPAERAYFDAAGIEAAQPTPDTVVAKTVYPGTSSSYPAVVAAQAPNVLVEYMVAVPPATAVEVRQEYGPLIASGIDGRLDLFSRDGDVSVFDATGWVEAGNERGKVTINRVHGDAVARTLHGQISFKGVSGDMRAIASTGAVRVDVPPRWVGEVSYHTVSGNFRSDLATFGTDLEPGDTGYVGVMRGPLAALKEAPTVRIRVDTASGDAVLASERATSAR